MRALGLAVLALGVSIAGVAPSSGGVDDGRAARVFVSDYWPNWSPDGRHIVFARTREVIDRRNGECCIVLRSTLHVTTANGRGLRSVRGSGHDGEPAWSPDGRLLAFIRGRRLWIMRPNGSGARPLRADHLAQAGPAWSPDGDEIAFWRGGLRTGGIFAIRPDGTGFRRIVAGADGYGGPSWSPDGRRLAFGRRFEIFVVNADGTGLRRVARGFPVAYYEPAWSPDGRRLVLRGDLGLIVVNADGTGKRRITRTPHELAQDTHPVWSPDGRRIAFSGFRGRPEEARIYVVAPNGSGLRRVTRRP